VCMTAMTCPSRSLWITNAALGYADMMGLHACKTLVGIMEDVEESLDDVRDDLHEVRAKTEGTVEATTLGIKPSQA